MLEKYRFRFICVRRRVANELRIDVQKRLGPIYDFENQTIRLFCSRNTNRSDVLKLFGINQRKEFVQEPMSQFVDFGASFGIVLIASLQFSFVWNSACISTIVRV